MTAGFRILNRTATAPKELVEAFAGLPVANVSDSMSRMTAAGDTLRPMHASGSMAGVALTVKTRPGDNLMLHRAIDMAIPGDVIVCDAGGEVTNALMGELMLAYAVKKGVAGFVLNGAIRDLDAFVEINLPTYAVGVTHRGPYKDDPNVIVTSQASGLDTIDKLVDAARENPAAITVGMSSLGGDDHFMLIKLENLTETEFTVVPFPGSAPARTALMGGHVAMGILNISEVANFQEELNILGVALDERSEFAPELPTFQEQGYNLVNGSMRGVVAPAGLPKEVEAQLRAAFESLSDNQEFLDAMKATANPVQVVTGEDFRALTSDLYDLAASVWEASPWN